MQMYACVYLSLYTCVYDIYIYIYPIDQNSLLLTNSQNRNKVFLESNNLFVGMK